MKIQLISLLLPCLFLFGGNLSIASNLDSGGTQLDIISSKTGHIVCSFELPNGLQLKKHRYKLTVYNKKNKSIYSVESSDLYLVLPFSLADEDCISIQFGGAIYSQKIKPN